LEAKENSVTKECKIHGMTKFIPCKQHDYYRYRCAKCNSDAVKKRRRKLKQMAIEYKGGCCANCGYNKSARALQFHHVDPNEKDFGLGKDGITRSWKIVKSEIDKCVLLCSNCHAEEHDKIEENK